MIRLDLNDLDLLIQALDFWVQDSVLPVIPKNRISRRKANHWQTNYLCMTKEWKHQYNHNKIRALCSLIIDHYGYIMVYDNYTKILINNVGYLVDWYNNKPTKKESWI